MREAIIDGVGQPRLDSWCQEIDARPLPVLSVTKANGKRRRNGNRKQIGLEPRKRRQYTETVFAFIKENPGCRKREIMGAHPPTNVKQSH